MYDRYTIGLSGEAIKEHFKVDFQEAFNPTFNASPSHQLPVLTSKKPDAIQLFHWGLLPKLSNNKSISPRLFNLPFETALAKPMYKKSLAENRCLIIADGFYAWKQLSKKQKAPYYFYFPKQEPFFIAGIWEEYEDFEGSVAQSFNMITVPSSGALTSYQEDCPAILSADSSKVWLNSDSQETDFNTIFEKIDPVDLTFHPVSPLINSLKINDQRLIEPTQPSDQHGNYTLF